MVFLDTNIVIYALGPAGPKKEPARKLLASPAALSIQVVNETIHVLQRKMGKAIADCHETARFLLSSCRVIGLEVQDVVLAMRLKEAHGFGHYDALIVANALNNGAEILYSEDMHDGLVLENRLRIVNPFEP